LCQFNNNVENYENNYILSTNYIYIIGNSIRKENIEYMSKESFILQLYIIWGGLSEQYRSDKPEMFINREILFWLIFK